jgi:hypothetical protein
MSGAVPNILIIGSGFVSGGLFSTASLLMFCIFSLSLGVSDPNNHSNVVLFT